MNRAQRAAFLRELAYSGNCNFACVAAGVTDRQARSYRRDAPAFDRLCRHAEDQARVAFRARSGVPA